MKKKTDFSHLHRIEEKHHYTSEKSYPLQDLSEVLSKVSYHHKVVSLLKEGDGVSMALYATKTPIIGDWVQTQSPTSTSTTHEHEVAIRVREHTRNILPEILTMLSHPSLVSMDVVNNRMFAQTSIIAKFSGIGDGELKELVAYWQQLLLESGAVLMNLMVNGVNVVSPGYYYSIEGDDDGGGEDGFKPPRSNRRHYDPSTGMFR